MTRPLGSNGRKKAAKEKNRESRITNTNNLVESSQASYAEAGQKLGCAKSTLWHRAHTRQSWHEANVHNQLLTPAEEDKFVEWLKELDHWSFHLWPKLVIKDGVIQIPGVCSDFRMKNRGHQLSVLEGRLATSEKKGLVTVLKMVQQDQHVVLVQFKECFHRRPESNTHGAAQQIICHYSQADYMIQYLSLVGVRQGAGWQPPATTPSRLRVETAIGRQAKSRDPNCTVYGHSRIVTARKLRPFLAISAGTLLCQFLRDLVQNIE
ncbi:hypothetical protein B0H17DRAFT_1135076 [Mycena rosella]|uniref:Uncharacterized protein n=1 Tax=Mycena rosella TaxID=1033263 RepID=A0AAD7GDG6_MYCRO|nr:hypothetical protein B0H17DRAFT_1135076 [Mycena rosella]